VGSDSRTLAEVLESASDVLFPAELGQKTIDVNSRGYDGDTPLHVMAWRRDAEGAQVLITAGADVDAVGDMGQTPLHVALGQNDQRMIQILVKAGARQDLRSEFGETAHELAIRLGMDIAE
jgi:uncharacterized protein